MEKKKLQVIDHEPAAVAPRDEAAEKIERLKALGLHSAARTVEAELKLVQAAGEMKRKLTMACEHFRIIKPEKIAEFNAILKEKTWKKTGMGGATYDQLVFKPLDQYGKVPPDHVLESLESAREMGCFEAFEVGVLESIEVRPDPLLLGRVKGCDFRFFIAQWDNDVRIEDILKENEG